jgi:hypothetical protein
MVIIIGKSTDDDFISKESKPCLAEDDSDSDSDSDSVTLMSETYSHFFKLSRAKMKRLEEFYRFSCGICTCIAIITSVKIIMELLILGCLFNRCP